MPLEVAFDDSYPEQLNVISTGKKAVNVDVVEELMRMDEAHHAQSVLLHREQTAFPSTESVHPKEGGKRGGAEQTGSAPTA